MSNTYVYDANQVAVSFFGIPIDSGYDEDEFLTIVQNEDDFSEIVGADGSAIICATNNRTATIQLKLLQSSSGNDKLSAIRLIQISQQNGTGMGPFLVKDMLGTSIFTALHTYIKKPPDVAYARAGKARVWTMGCTDLIRFTGGNTAI